MLATCFYHEGMDLHVLLRVKDLSPASETCVEEVGLFRDGEAAGARARELDLKMGEEPLDDPLRSLIRVLKEYLSGKPINPPHEIQGMAVRLKLDEKFPTSFARRVIECVKRLEYGEIVPYSEIGSRIGSRAYRAIGSVLKANPLPLLIPCHRVVRKDGSVGGFMGKNQEGAWQVLLKERLIAMERSARFRRP